MTNEVRLFSWKAAETVTLLSNFEEGTKICETEKLNE